MGADHVEVERKYAVDDGWVMPRFSALDGVTTQDPVDYVLEAVYWDTRRLDLVRTGTTLRRRTGGHDAGWHLKLPSGDDRIEVQAPLSDRAFEDGESSQDDVPAELRSLVRARTRGRPLVPVARLVSHRTSRRLTAGDGDVVLVEVTDDEVTAQLLRSEPRAAPGTSAWREVEAELVDGDPALLEDVARVLLESGAQPAADRSKLGRALASRLDQQGTAGPGEDTTRAVDVLLGYVGAQVEQLTACDPALRRGAPEAVHDMRVATRRLRSALRSYRPLLDRAVTERLRQELAWLAGVLGTARDAEVMRGRLLGLVASQPPELVLGPVSQRLDDEFSTVHRAAVDEVVAALDSTRYLALLDGLDQLRADPPVGPDASGPPVPTLRKQVKRDCRRVRPRVHALTDDDTADDRAAKLHEVRKAAKRARYSAELASGVLGDRANRVATAFERIQDALGEHQDSVVARTHLRRVAVEAYLDGGNAFTFGRLHALEEYAGDAAASRLEALWHAAAARAKAL